VDQIVHIARPKDKTSAKLQRVFAQLMLAMAAGLGAFARQRVVFAKQVEEGSLLQAQQEIRFALLVNQKWELDSGFLAEGTGVLWVAQSDCRETGSLGLELLFVIAQLRNVLAAEDSTIMAKKSNYSRPVSPQRPELHWFAINIGQSNFRQLAAEGVVHEHAAHFQAQHGKLSSESKPKISRRFPQMAQINKIGRN
jgi:hypothetical protein